MTYTIMWADTQASTDPQNPTRYNVVLMKGISVNNVLQSASVSGITRYNWLVDSSLADGSDYKIRVTKLGTSVYGDSAVFTIRSAGGVLSCTPVAGGQLAGCFFTGQNQNPYYSYPNTAYTCTGTETGKACYLCNSGFLWNGQACVVGTPSGAFELSIPGDVISPGFTIYQGTGNGFQVSAGYAFASPVTLSLSSLPAGVTYSFSPPTITPIQGQTSNLALTGQNNALVGTYTVVITGTGGGITRTRQFTLIIGTTGACIGVTCPAGSTCQNGACFVNGLPLCPVAGTGSSAGCQTSAPPSAERNASCACTESGKLCYSCTSGKLWLPDVTNAFGGSCVAVAGMGFWLEFPELPAPPKITIPQNRSGSFTVVGRPATFASPIALSVVNLTQNVTASFSRTSITPNLGESSVLTLNVSANASVGNYTFNVTGQNGTMTRNYTVKLEVANITTLCTDSDGGRNYTLKGTVFFITAGATGIGAQTDNCTSSGALTEWFCAADGSARNETYACLSGQICQNGACVSAATPPVVSLTEQEILAIIMNLDNLQIQILNAKTQAEDTAMQFRDLGNTQRARVYAQAATSLQDVADTIDATKQFIRSNMSNPDAIKERVRHDTASIRANLIQIIQTLLNA
jgi:hypothetical protein